MKIVYLLLIYPLLLCCAAFPARAQRICATPRPPQQTPLYSRPSSPQEVTGSDTSAGEIINIPVVIHILYNSTAQNISDAQVLSQLESLNKDYRRLNNIATIPAAFSSLSADAKITFCLAKTAPNGKATTGIIRKFTRVASWLADDAMKFSAAAGDDAWDAKKYLNVWVCNLFGRNLGYSSLPGSPADKDGVVIQYDVFGTTGNVRSPFDKGRTATHEIGHWLGLLHLWGDALCGDDLIADTPPQKSYNNGCPSFPHTSTCSVNANGDMFMNFMDFTDDACMSMFTRGQVKKMRSQFAPGNVRNSFLSSSACNAPAATAPLSPDTLEISSTGITPDPAIVASLYPNPAKDFINIEAKNSNDLTGQALVIYNILGREVKRQVLTSSKNSILIRSIPAGVYIIKIGEGREVKVMRLVKQ